MHGVRRTFLGSETSECSRILDIVLKTAISHPEIRFDYKVGDRAVFTGVPGELRSRIAEAIGSKVAKSLLPVDYTEAGVHVTGFISPTTETNGKRNHQFLFMRNRPIENKMVSKAVSQAYEPYGAQCKPVTVLFLDMPDMEFDINVHPAKREVRFANGNLVFLVVTHAIRDTFTKDLEANSPFIDLSDELMGNTAQPSPAQNDLPWEAPTKPYTPWPSALSKSSSPQARSQRTKTLSSSARHTVSSSRNSRSAITNKSLPTLQASSQIRCSRLLPKSVPSWTSSRKRWLHAAANTNLQKIQKDDVFTSSFLFHKIHNSFNP